jgi:hypothetical protein
MHPHPRKWAGTGATGAVWGFHPHFIHIFPILLFSVWFLNTFPDITAR